MKTASCSFLPVFSGCSILFDASCSCLRHSFSPKGIPHLPLFSRRDLSLARFAAFSLLPIFDATFQLALSTLSFSLSISSRAATTFSLLSAVIPLCFARRTSIADWLCLQTIAARLFASSQHFFQLLPARWRSNNLLPHSALCFYLWQAAFDNCFLRISIDAAHSYRPSPFIFSLVVAGVVQLLLSTLHWLLAISSRRCQFSIVAVSSLSSLSVLYRRCQFSIVAASSLSSLPVLYRRCQFSLSSLPVFSLVAASSLSLLPVLSRCCQCSLVSLSVLSLVAASSISCRCHFSLVAASSLSRCCQFSLSLLPVLSRRCQFSLVAASSLSLLPVLSRVAVSSISRRGQFSLVGSLFFSLVGSLFFSLVGSLFFSLVVGSFLSSLAVYRKLYLPIVACSLAFPAASRLSLPTTVKLPLPRCLPVFDYFSFLRRLRLHHSRL